MCAARTVWVDGIEYLGVAAGDARNGYTRVVLRRPGAPWSMECSLPTSWWDRGDAGTRIYTGGRSFSFRPPFVPPPEGEASVEIELHDEPVEELT